MTATARAAAPGASDAMELTPEQRAAVETPGSVVVRAGAGSGKTAVLVARYVRLVCGDGAPPLDVAQVLAVTFTDKAAAEMRNRIRGALAARAAAATGVDRARLLRTQRALASARIGTIHALAASLLRRAPLESGTRPGAAVLDEIDGPAWTERAVRRLLLERLRAGDADVRACVDAWGFGSPEQRTGLAAVTCDVLAVLARRAVDVETLGSALARQRAAVAACGRDICVDTGRIVALVEGWLADAAPPRARQTPSLAEFCDRWPEWRAHLAALAAAPPANVNVTNSTAGADPDATGATAGGRESALRGDTRVAHLLALRDFCPAAARAFRRRVEWPECAARLTFKVEAGAPRFGGALAAAVGCAAALPLAAAFTHVVRETHATLARVKRREGVLTFDDLIAQARALLGDAGTAARLAGDVRAVLVDEFQDTDPAQVDLLRRLAGDHAELFVVGDEKQSIYRFRGAEVQLFAEMGVALGGEVPLADNFRSRPPLLAFVNGLAARLFAARAEDAPWRVRWSATQRLRARRTDADDGADGGRTSTGPLAGGDGDRTRRREGPRVRVKSLVAQIGAGDAELLVAAARALEARVVATTITDLVGEGWRPRDIAVLLPALTQVKAYEFALRRWQIPYAVVRGRGFYECQEVRDLVQLLVSVVDEDDAIALAGALRSPLFGLSDGTLAVLADHPGGLPARFRGTAPLEDLGADDAAAAGAARELLHALRAVRDRVPADDLLARAVAATQLEAVLLAQFHGVQKVANVRKLLAQARAAGEGGFVAASEFAARARRLLDLEPHEPEAPHTAASGDVVQVMTVHQAKGLEFPVVIVADLGREPLRDYRAPALVDREHGVLAFATIGAGRHRLPHRLAEAWRRDDHARADAERARLLYVACTRARDVLVLSEGKGRRAALAPAADQTPDRTWCEQLWAFLGREAVAEFVASAAERAILMAPGEGADGEAIPVAVEIEKSGALLARVPAPARDLGDGALARALDAQPTAADLHAVARVWDAPTLPRGPLVASPTAIVDYARCPRQFWYRHVRGIAEGRARAGAIDDAHADGDGGRTGGRLRPADAARLGIAAHAALEALDLDLPVSAQPAAVAAVLQAVRDLDDAERETLARDLVGALARHAADGGSCRIHGRELPFCVRLDGMPEIFVRGRIDLLAERGERLVIRDYKYTSPEDDGEAHRVQLEIYALAVAAAYPARALEGEIEWLRAPAGRVAVAIDLAVSRERVGAIAARLVAALDARTAAAFPMAFSVPAPCRALGCPFVSRCFPRARREGVAT